MYCSISGEVPVEPVISAQGYLFEHRLISDHIARTGTCPITQETLGEDQLTPVKVNTFVRPREVQATSIPALLASFQNEWDAVMQQTFELRKQLAQVKQEYADALYREDAAKRVIARLLQERDDARAHQAGAAGDPAAAAAEEAPEAMDIDSSDGLSQQQEAALEQKAAQLAATRKQRQTADSLTSRQTLAHFKAVHSNSYHQSASKKGVAVVAVNPKRADQLLTAGQDGVVNFVSKGAASAATSVKVGSKAINAATFVRDGFAANSANVVSYWAAAAGGSSHEKRATFSNHSSVVYSLSAHPTGDFIFSTSKDNSWAMLDLISGALVYSVTAEEQNSRGLLAGCIHPDGLLFGTGGGDNAFRIWDVRSHANVITKTHEAAVSAVAFSEAGYVAATGDLDGNVKLWDLRQLRGEPLVWTGAAAGNVHDLKFDHSGHYLAVAAKNIGVYHLDDVQISDVVSLKGHSKKVTSVSWGPDATYLASSSLDQTVKIWQAV